LIWSLKGLFSRRQVTPLLYILIVEYLLIRGQFVLNGFRRAHEIKYIYKYISSAPYRVDDRLLGQFERRRKTFPITASKCELMPGPVYVLRMVNPIRNPERTQHSGSNTPPTFPINGTIFGTPFWRFRKFLLLHTWAIWVPGLPFPLPRTQLVDAAITLSQLQKQDEYIVWPPPTTGIRAQSPSYKAFLVLRPGRTCGRAINGVVMCVLIIIIRWVVAALIKFN